MNKTCRTCRAACNGAGREGNANQCTFHTTEGSSLPPPFDVESVVKELVAESIILEDNYGDEVECIPKETAIKIIRKGGVK